jgi:hypothetical protein
VIRRIFSLLLAAALLAAATAPSRGVIVAGGDGTQNTTAPADDFGFEEVAQLPEAGGIYLGNGWILCAYHEVCDASKTGFNPIPNVTLNGTSYSADSSTAVRLSNGDGSMTDLALFRLTAVPPDLPGVTIASVTPAQGAGVTLAGYGHDRAVDETHWLIDPDTHVWTETSGAGDAQGYLWAPTRELRWGVSTLTAFSDGSATEMVNDAYGVTQMFLTGFSSQDGSALASVGDSGGGVFQEIGSSWVLAGTMLDLGNLDGQPDSTAVFGDVTASADLSAYRAQILAIIPEPGSAGLLLAGAGALAATRRRKHGVRGDERG